MVSAAIGRSCSSTSRRPRRQGDAVERALGPGSERGGRHEERPRERRAGAAGGEPQQPAAREAVVGVYELLDRLFGCSLVPMRIPRLHLLLLGHEVPGGKREAGGEGGKREAEREAEQLRVGAGEVDEPEGETAETAETEQGQHEQLRARAGRGRPLGPWAGGGGASPPAARGQQHEADDEPAAERPHWSVRSPSSRMKRTRTTPARNQATRPSGTGPSSPRLQPPGLRGACVHST